MVALPQQLFSKASACGLTCIASEKGEHRIEPKSQKAQASPWSLTCQKGAWVLIVNGVPQIRFQYEEALRFLDRLDIGYTSLVRQSEPVLIHPNLSS